MQFALYLLSISANLFIVAFVPGALASVFLSSYAASSLVGGVGMVLAFSSQRAVDQVSRWLPLVLLSLVFVSLSLPNPGLWILYAGALLASDYTVSQSLSLRLTTIYRLAVTLTAFPFAFLPAWFSEMILARVIICFLFIGIALFGSQKLFALALRNSSVYVLVSHVAYFGTLLLITILLTDDALRYWYIGTQIGLGLLLRRLDFSIRGLTVTQPRLKILTTSLAVGLVVPLMAFWFSAPALLAYLSGAAAISQLDRFVK